VQRAASGQLEALPSDHEVWEYVVHYVAALCVNLVLLVSPERIVLGGG
jgi:fructokinase